MAKCKAKTKAGRACGAPPLRTSGLCIAHDPAAEGTRREARRAGGKERAKAMSRAPADVPEPAPSWREFRTTSDVARGLAFVVGEVLDARLDARAANACTAGMNALLAAIRNDEIEARIAEIERALGARRHRA